MSTGAEVWMEPDVTALNNALEELARLTDKSYPQAVRGSGRLLAVQLAARTYPSYNPSKNAGADEAAPAARLQGEAAVRRDFSRVYASPQTVARQLKDAKTRGEQTGEQVAKGFMSLLRRGKLDEAKLLLRQSGIAARSLDIIKWDDGALHKRARDNRGRVSKSRRPVITTAGTKQQAYRRLLISRVGLAKSGWANAARELGGARGIPQWAKRHAGTGGAIDRAEAWGHAHVVVSNDVRYIQTVCNSRQQRAAMAYVEANLRTQIDKINEANIRKAGL